MIAPTTIACSSNSNIISSNNTCDSQTPCWCNLLALHSSQSEAFLSTKCRWPSILRGTPSTSHPNPCSSHNNSNTSKVSGVCSQLSTSISHQSHTLAII